MSPRFFAPSRLAWAVLALFTIAAGLASRKFAFLLPSWLAKNAGDALYATMAFWLVRLVFPRLRSLGTAVAALGVCAGIEFAKLYHAPWAEAIRALPGSRLFFGYVFHGSNMAWYVIGVLLACVIEAAVTAKSASS